MALSDALWEEICRGDLDAVQGLLKRLQDEEDMTCLNNYPPASPQFYLHEACKLGLEDIVNYLVAYYEDLNQVSPEGTPLFLACENGHYDIVDSLLVNKVHIPVPCTTSEKCPLYISAFHGWQEILDLIVEKAPGMSDDPFVARWCLEGSVCGGQCPLAKIWFNRFRRLHNSEDAYQLMPQLMSKACQAGHADIVEFLLTCGAQLTPDIVDLYPDTVGTVLSMNLVPFMSYTEDHAGGNRAPDREQGHVFIVAKWNCKNLHLFHQSWISLYVDAIAELDISSNHLMALPVTIPWSLPNLIKLDVSRNILLALDSPKLDDVQCAKLQHVNLSHNNLQKIPVEIFHLPFLKQLDLSHNKILNLTEFQLMENLQPEKFSPDTKPFHLPPRAQIRVERQGPKTPVKMSGIIDFDQVWSCLSLEKLDLSYNCLSQLPPQLHMCGRLTSLRVTNNQLTSFLSPWTSPLDLLDLSENALCDLPPDLDLMWEATLTKLYIHHNSLSSIPDCVCRLKNLQVLDLSHNLLEVLPSPGMWTCGQLEELKLSHNKLSYISSDSWCFLRSAVGVCTMTENFWPEDPAQSHIIFQDSLSDLDLSYNQLRSVPPTVCSLHNLRQLLLHNNPELQTLPPALGNLQECFELSLAGTHVTNVPRELIHGCPLRARAILAHLKHQLRRAVPFNEIKLMFVGRERKGKTSLTALLQNKSAPANVATNGIMIQNWKVAGSSIKRRIRARVSREAYPDVVFQLWDFAGQDDFYITHKLFLSPSALYLVLYDLRLHREGVKSIKPWLLDIEAHAPRSHVIIVGTFLDYLNKDGRSRIPEMHKEIYKLYKKSSGYPEIDDIVEVSCKTKEGIDTLRDAIYTASFRMEYRGSFGRSTAFGRAGRSEEKVIGRMVPQSYMDLGKMLKLESYSRRRHGKLPILNTDHILDIATSMDNSDIHSLEELELAITFLHEAGYILHYQSTLRGLNELHFTDPSWLADSLSKLITVDVAHQCMSGGLLDLGNAQTLLFTEETHRSARLGQYVDLLEQFNIALLIDPQRLLIPSKLYNMRPSSIDQSLSRDKYYVLHRVYYMKCVPSGFWPRLTIQLITMLQRVCQQIIFPVELSSNNIPSSSHEMEWDRIRISYGSLPLATRPVHVKYWQQGISLDFQEGVLVLETCANVLTSRPSNEDGVIITVASEKSDNLSVMGFAVDQLESIISQWFSGLIDETNPIGRHIPCPGCMELLHSVRLCAEMFMFTVQDCVSQYLADQHIRYQCPKCGRAGIKPEALIPDFTLADLPQYLHLDENEVQFDRNDLIGSGGEGFVYKGTFGTHVIAYKQSAVYQSIQQCRPQLMESGRVLDTDFNRQSLPWQLEGSSEADQSGASMAGHMSLQTETTASSLDSVKWLVQYKLLPAFQDFRKEVALLSTLEHPCVVSLLGVLPPHLSYVMELATLGSLHDVLEREYLQQRELHPHSQRRNKLSILLGRIITCKIVYEIAAGLEYLHKRKVVYKDLKPRNVLVWSLDPDEATNVKLSDYGLSSYLTPQGVRGCEGTLGYQAPEMRHGSSYNQKVDIFALGMVIYQLLTGMQLFSNLPSVIIPKQIQAGRRPELKDSRVDPDIPKLVTLMETCWATDPGARPVSAEIVAQIRSPSFWMLSHVIGKKVSPVCSVYQGQSDTEPTDDVLHLVTDGQSPGQCAAYYALTPACGQLSRQRPLPGMTGSKVMCMVNLGPAIVLGCEDPSIRVYSTTQYKEACSPWGTQDVPLAIVHRKVKDPSAFDYAFVKDVVISFADGSICRYVVCMTSKTIAVLEPMAQCHLGSERHVPDPVRSLMLMERSEKLWAGHGAELVVLDTTSLGVVKRLNCTEDDGYKDVIAGMCCHGDQAWLFLRGSYSIIEVDVQTLTTFCKFDCAMGSESGVMTVQWFHDSAVSTVPTPEPRENIERKKKSDKLTTGIHRQSASRLTVRKSQHDGKQAESERVIDAPFAGDRRSILRKSARCQSLRRHSGPKTHRPRHRERQYKVRSLCYLKGAIWVGRRCGDILVINVTQNNACNYKYGEVVAVLCNEYLSGYCNGSVDHLTHSGDSVTAMRSVYNAQNSSGHDSHRAEIVVWKAMCLEDINKTQSYWQTYGK